MTSPAVRDRNVRAAADRHRWAVDVGIALAAAAVGVGAGAASSAWHNSQHAGPGWPAYLLLVLAGLALVWRRRYPVPVLIVTLAATVGAGAAGAHGFIWPALIVAFFTAVLARRRVAAVLSLAIGYLASLWPPWRLGSPGYASVAIAVGVAAWLLVLLAVAELLRMRGQRRAELARSRAEQLARRASEERMLIARDLHDVVAHNISVINVQASTALHLMDRQPERAREALSAIHDVSKQALAELRSVLGVLRASDDAAPRMPSPGLAQLDDLARAVGRAGLSVRLTVDGPARRLTADADLAAYRIVQEALTNVSKHSASRQAVVAVSHEPGGVVIEITDPGPGRTGPPADSSAGNGITGMRERAAALGGTLAAGGRPGGGFGVLAWLPQPTPSGRAPAGGSAA